MATLKGLFETKPRQRKNFLLENIKEVRRKSNQQKRTETRSASIPRRRKRSPVHSPLTRHRPKSHHSPCRSRPSRSAQDDPCVVFEKGAGRKHCCLLSDHDALRSSSCGQANPNLSARTMHYIEQENVPFEWTEVCPSLISHTICHQSVQTDVRKAKSKRATDRASAQGNGEDLKSGRLESSTKNESELRSSDGHTNSKQSDKSVQEFKAEKELTSRTNLDSEHSSVSSEEREVTKLVSDVENLKISPRCSSEMKEAKDPLLPPPHYQIGVVPKYLSKRKSEQKLQSTQANLVDPSCPAGHIVMPDNERKETLDLILKSYNELVTELNKMPVRTDTLKMRKRKIELERQLDKLEEGIRVFSRSKVYVKLDA